MKILTKNNELNKALNNVSNLGFVPTMGGLHKGHISLIKKSKKKCTKTLVSIFVNPKQFNNKKDYKEYPRNNKKDLFLLKKLNVDYVYLPKISDVYNSKKKRKIKLDKKDLILCAKFRKGHFEGVIDVMDRLINLIKPKQIFMGEKDFQQIYLVKKYIKIKDNTKIISCKTIRSNNLLAFSSRNFLLKKKDLIKAEKLIYDLMSFKKKIKKTKISSKLFNDIKNEIKKKYNIKLEYIELRKVNNLKKTNNLKNSKLFVAYYINNIRLIDNF